MNELPAESVLVNSTLVNIPDATPLPRARSTYQDCLTGLKVVGAVVAICILVDIIRAIVP